MRILVSLLACVVLIGFPALAQDVAPDTEVIHPNQRLVVTGLSSATASDASAAAIARSALAVVLSASKTTCDPDSPIEASAAAVGESSLLRLAGKISGAACLTDGGARRVTATFVPYGAIQPDSLITPILRGTPLLLEWKHELFVLYGVVYDEHLHSDGHRDNIIRELLLLDPRYSGLRRNRTFVRGRDDFAEVAGIAIISVR